MRNMGFDAGDIKLFVDGKEIGNAAYAEVGFEEPEEKITPFSFSASGTFEAIIVNRRFKRPDGTVWEVRTFDTRARRLEDCIILGIKKVRDNGLRRRHRAIERARKEMFKHIVRHEGIEGIIKRAVAKQ